MPRSGEDARARLQKAALELFGARGYDSVTAAEIAARAGVTERTFFRHFPDKKEVLFAGEAEFVEALTGAVGSAPPALPPLEALLWALRAVAPSLEAYRPYSETRHKVIAAAPALRERELAKAAALVGRLTEALRQRGVEGSTAALAAHMAMAAFQYAMNSWMTEASDGLTAHLDRAFEQVRALSGGASGR